MLTSGRSLTIAMALASSLILLQAPSAEALFLSPGSSNALSEGYHAFGAYKSKQGSFTDTYRFTIAGDTDANAMYGVLSLPGAPFFDILDLQINGKPQGKWHRTMLESGQEHLLMVTGNVTGIFGGAYGGKLKLSFVDQAAVPLPAAAWLFLSALGSLLLIGRTRRQYATADAI